MENFRYKIGVEATGINNKLPANTTLFTAEY
jgi:hypothetical protein